VITYSVPYTPEIASYSKSLLANCVKRANGGRLARSAMNGPRRWGTAAGQTGSVIQSLSGPAGTSVSAGPYASVILRCSPQQQEA
jgi:hypothetical protein